MRETERYAFVFIYIYIYIHVHVAQDILFELTRLARRELFLHCMLGFGAWVIRGLACGNGKSMRAAVGSSLSRTCQQANGMRGP